MLTRADFCHHQPYNTQGKNRGGGADPDALLACPKVGALAFVSYKVDRDRDGRTLTQVREAILGAMGDVSR